MKKVMIMVLIALLFLAFVDAHADDVVGGPVKKLGRGFANLVTSPFYVFKGMGDTAKKNGWMAGATWGLLEGAVNLVKRASVGAYEIVTFPVPLPANYEPILKDPEFFTDNKDRRLSIYRTK